MTCMTRRDGELAIENVLLNSIAEQQGTPCYVYSRAAISEAFQSYATALEGQDHLICYAVKANSNLAVLNVLARLGSGFDIVSLGELERVLAAGGDADRVVFSGVGKTPVEMRRALEVGIRCFNVESIAELETLNQVAGESGHVAPVSIRVNPDVDAQTHPYISTGLKDNKFGIDIQSAPSVYQQAQAMPNIEVHGIDCHIGSQLTDTSPFLDAMDRVLDLMDALAEQDIHVRHLDLGGGLGVVYRDEQVPAVGDYITQVRERLGERLGDRKVTLMFEPGRSLVANAGVLLTEVLYLKHNEHKNFAVVDAAMNDMLRPSLYEAWMDLQPLSPRKGEEQVYDVVGPICETGDFIAKERELCLEQGDLLALCSAGAYGFVMSSNYNSRTRASEVMVDGDQFQVVRERETLSDLWRGEHCLP